MTTLSLKASVLRALLFLLLSFSLSSLQAQVCDNLTDGGTIIGDESGCGDPTYDPSLITSTAPASGGSGDIEYVWMKTTGNPDSPFNTWQIIPGATGESYDPTPISETTYYGRCSRRSGCTEYVGETNFVVKSISCCDINATITPANSTICPSQPLAFTAIGNGTGLTYIWEATGGNFDDSTAANPTYTMMMEGTYTIKLTIIKDDCMEMAETTVTVANQLDVAISATSSTINVNEVLQLNSNVPGDNKTYMWTATGGAFSNNTIANPTYSATTVGDYEIYLETTDENGCSGLDTFDISVSSCSLLLIGIAENTSCTGGNDGSITLTVSGESGTVTYAWSQASIGNTANPTGLAAGTYSVTATDESGCSDNQTIEVGTDAAFTLSADIKAPTCANENDGQILITVNGGSPAYTYNWSNSLPDTNFVNNLPSSTYELTVTDADGCQATGSYTVNAANSLTLTTTTTAPNCGATDGSATVTASGGNAPYTYAWNDAANQTTATATNLASGMYQVVVTDGNGCQNMATATVEGSNNSNIVLTTTVTNTNCNSSTGAIDLTISGGTAPYTIAWDNGIGAVEDPMGLVAGTYNVTVTDAANCSNTTNAVVEEESSVSVSINKTDIDCNGSTTGTATAVATGGSGTYTYIWDSGLPANANQTGLVAGTYTVTATDENGCQSTATTTITQPALLSVVASPTATNCTDPNGSAMATVTGGTAPYTYLWNDANNQTTQTAVNLAPGDYIVVVTDANACTQAANVTISANMGLVVTLITTDALCNGENSGTITTNVVNGTAPYTYQWNNFLPDFPGFTGLAQGTYEVTVTDANGCFGTASAKVHSADSLLVNPVVENASCSENDGRARLDVTGGTPPYSYAWAAPLNNFTNTVTGLSTGSYEYTVTDGNGCSKIDVIIVLRDTNCMDTCQVNGGSISTADTTTICAGDGIADDITVTLSGNQGANTQWVITDENLNILELPNTNTFNFDGAGFGTCLIWNLSFEGTVGGLVVGQNAANLTGCQELSNSILVIRQDCTPMDTCRVNGGMISTTDTTTICAGDGIADDITVTLSGNQGLNTQWVITDENLNILELPNTNTFNFDGAGFGTCLIWNLSFEGTVGGLVVGQNAANLTGCQELSNSILVIRQDCTPMDTCRVNGGIISTTDTTTICAGDGIADDITVTLSGNQGPNTQWIITDENLNILELPNNNTFDFDGAGFGTCLIWNLSFEGTVGGLVVGQNAANLTGCQELSNSILVIRQDCTPMDTCKATPSTISTADATVFCVGDGNADTVRVNLSLGSGDFSRFIITDTALNILEISTNTIYDFENTAVGVCLLWNLTYDDGLTGLMVGNNISDLMGCSALSNAITIVRQDCTPDPCLNFAGSVTINNPANGTICGLANVVLSTSPAEADFTYAWTATGGTFDDATSATPTYSMMMPGTYEIIATITQGNCVTIDTTTITIVAGPSVVLTTTDINCLGENEGSITATVSGGTAPYSYSWNLASLGDTNRVNNLAAGFYEVTVTDANGCTTTDATTIAVGTNISVALMPVNPTCGGIDDGSITARITGGTAPFTYNWSNGGSDTGILDGLGAGNYSLTVTDANGCSVSDNALLTAPTPFDISIISTPRDICPGGTVNFGAAPADTTLTYQWTATGGSFDDANSVSPTYTMMMPGTYQIILTASNGTCTAVDTTTVLVREGPAIALTFSDVQCAGDSTGAINVIATSPNLPITYTWNNGIGNVANPTNLPAGTYDLTVTDGAGCSITVTTTIGERSNLNVNLSSTNLDCNGVNNGQIIATSTGGVAPVIYAWSNGVDNQDTISNLAAGTYTVTATDGIGCAKTATLTLTEPNPIFVNINNAATGTVCPGTPVNLTVTPIDTSLTYSWTATGGNFDDATSPTPVYTMMMAGTYEIIVMVSDGICSASDTTTVTIGEGIDFTTNATDISCNGETDGSITINVTSGVAPITYTWDNGIGNIPNPSGLAAGTYNLTITDGNNCMRTTSVTIEEAEVLFVGLSPTNILCGGENTGAVDALIIGTTDSLAYLWSNGATGASIDSLMAGTYGLTVTNAKGCTAIDSVTITAPTPLTATAEGAAIGCNDAGRAYVTATGGTAPYTYLWNDALAQTTDTAFNLVAGVYNVVVTDANGCTESESVTITETDGITCSITVIEDIKTFNGTEGVLGVTVSGGSGNYTYSWNNGGMDSVIINLSTNTYIVTITDETGCVCTDTLRLLNPAILGDYVFLDVDSSGTQNAGDIPVEGVTLQLTGTTYYGTNIVRTTMTDMNGIYQFPVPPGDYKVTVVDAFGFAFTTQNTGGDDAIDSDFDPNTNMSQVVTLNENDVNLTIDLGLLSSNECKNILLGGQVEKDETLCMSDADPAIITNVAFPTGGMGQIEYLWLKSDITNNYFPGHPDWDEIPNSNAPDYDPGIITKTTYYIRCARRAGCDSYPGESNIITKTVIDCAASPAAGNLRTTVQGNQVELIWEGKIPYENGHYMIERSLDGGTSYQVVSSMPSPLSENMEEHHFMDKTPQFGENYYRVKTVVPNMSNAFTNIAMAMLKPADYQGVLIYPNPVQKEVTVQFFEELKEVAKVQIVNGFGQVVKSFEMDTATKKQQFSISDLPSGMYFIKFDNRALKRYGQKIYKVEE